MNKTTHTPLPALFYGGTTIIHNQGHAEEVAELTLESPDNPGEHGGETIAYVSPEWDREIRKAVNSHDRLVEALRGVIGAHQTAMRLYRQNDGEHYSNEDVARARALLAELEGGA